MTIAQMYSRLEEKMTMETPLVNFGKHAECQYKDILQTHRSYGNWVIDTAAENPGSHWRLCRLAEWLKENWDRPLTQGPTIRVEDQKKINKDQNNNKAMRSKEKLIRIKKQNLVT